MSLTRRARSPRVLITVIFLGLFALTATAVPTAGATGTPTSQPPASYIVVDAETGAVLMASNEHAQLYPASTIKVLTALVALEHLPQSAKLKVSKLAAGRPASKIDMREGSTWPLDQALPALMIISANDAAYALAENAGGSLAGFAAMAAKTGQRLGLQDTSFHDPAGLDGPESFEGGTKSSAFDLSIVARNALTIPAIAEPASRVTYEFTDPTGAGRHLVSHNKAFLTTYPGAIGLKTGFTHRASRTLITAARREGHTLIAVVMQTWDVTGWASYLLDQGFAGARGGPKPAHLPAVRIATVDGRTDAFTGLPHTLGSAAAVASVVTPRTKVSGATAAHASAPAKTARAKATRTTVGPKNAATGSDAAATGSSTAASAALLTAALRATRAAPGQSSGSSWSSALKILGIVFLGLVIVVVLLRRRAIRRQRARRIERLRAHREARRRGMIDIIEVDDAETAVQVVPMRTSHHVAATGKRHPADRRVLRPTRPRDTSRSTNDHAP